MACCGGKLGGVGRRCGRRRGAEHILGYVDAEALLPWPARNARL
jgi:hypothetical protein